MSQHRPTIANQPQFTEVFDTTSPILRAWLPVFETDNTAEVLSVPAQGPNFYITKITSPGGIEIAFDSPGPNWSPARPGMGFEGQNFRKVYLRRTGNADFFDSAEFFTGGARLSNFTQITRPSGRRTYTTTGHFLEGIIATANPKREKITFRAKFPTTDGNDACCVGFGATLEIAQANALETFSADFFNNGESRNITRDNDLGQTTFNNLAVSGPYIFTNSNTGVSGSIFMRLTATLKNTQDVYMACYDSANNTFGFPTFANTPSFLNIEETIYDD